MKEIIKEDVELIKQKAKEYLHSDVTNIERMGGLTNHTYKVTCGDTLYSFRIPGEGTESLINRFDEETSTRLACNLGIDAKLIIFEKNGFKITEYIKDAITLNSKTFKNHINEIAKIFKKLHKCDIDTKVIFDVFDMAKIYENDIIKNKIELYDDYFDVKNVVFKIRREINDSYKIKLVPCHNDPLCENWILGDDKLYLIDWEYAGMNDAYWDLADVSIEGNFTNENEIMLLRNYLDSELNEIKYKRFLANKIYVDYLWTLWALTRVPYNKVDMQNWADSRYSRLKDNIKIYFAL